MFGATVQLGLRPVALPKRGIQAIVSSTVNSSSLVASSLRRSISSRALQQSPQSTLKSPRKTTVAFPLRQSSTPTTTSPSFFTPSLCRHASTSASPTAPRTSTSAASRPAGKQAPATKLDWNTFFKLRTSRRRYSLAFSLLSAVATTAGCGFAISVYPEVADFVAKTIPTDPFVSMGIATFAATLLGWLIGPFFGNGIWRLLHRSKIQDFLTKEKGFFERIKRHRVDPQGASTNNPVPDYYGEKVGSVGGYRRWLKDQRAFNRKRSGGFV